ncbi:chaplin [Streptomyces sp. DSM 44917]|uniref:Chaplin n=1 Tax=Streptomyces boetiae TaxID=3075541 RepID=A0ABU2L2Z2_9ACTN|nr:chaplin [Streptomyces sp. DSM 44917]MDT0305935.1 chaplin [Streptomyces sp. DSM 44917]
MIKKVVAVAAATSGLMLAGAGVATAAGDGAQGVAAGSPGVISGNVIQVPIKIPVQVCGNTVNIIALLNPAFGNTCLSK